MSNFNVTSTWCYLYNYYALPNCKILIVKMLTLLWLYIAIIIKINFEIWYLFSDNIQSNIPVSHYYVNLVYEGKKRESKESIHLILLVIKYLCNQEHMSKYCLFRHIDDLNIQFQQYHIKQVVHSCTQAQTRAQTRKLDTQKMYRQQNNKQTKTNCLQNTHFVMQ